jgi:hypothetical protein
MYSLDFRPSALSSAIERSHSSTLTLKHVQCVAFDGGEVPNCFAANITIDIQDSLNPLVRVTVFSQVETHDFFQQYLIERDMLAEHARTSEINLLEECAILSTSTFPCEILVELDESAKAAVLALIA